MPSKIELSDFYANRYRRVMNKAKDFDAYFLSPNYRAQVLSQVGWLATLLPKTGRWLDVGAGLGILLWQASQELPEWQYYAIEPDTDARMHLQKRATIETDFELFWSGKAFPGIEFDVISSSHVLEHLVDPFAALVQMSNFLKKGGYLLIEVPHDDRFELLNPNRLSDLPHLWFFTEAGLTGLLRDVGLEVVRSGIVGLQRPGVRPNLFIRLMRGVTRRLRGPLSLLEFDDWYAEGVDRCNLRVVCRKSSGD